jgi:hypothetical protein
MRLPIRRPSAATSLALLALFVALGGTGYAAVTLPRGSVGALQIRDGAVVSSKVHDGTLLARDFAPGELVPAALPPGRTQRGVYYVGSSSAAGNQLATGEISFPIALPRPPVAHFVRREGSAPVECGGTPVRPTAAPGHLCIYEARQRQASEHRVLDPVSGEADGVVRVWGAALSVRSTQGGDMFSAGTWAVTAAGTRG